jgi:hypothetical protein
VTGSGGALPPSDLEVVHAAVVRQQEVVVAWRRQWWPAVVAPSFDFSWFLLLVKDWSCRIEPSCMLFGNDFCERFNVSERFLVMFFMFVVLWCCLIGDWDWFGISVVDELGSMHRLDSSRCIEPIFLAHKPMKGAGFQKVIGAGSDICAASIVPVGKTDT